MGFKNAAFNAKKKFQKGAGKKKSGGFKGARDFSMKRGKDEGPGGKGFFGGGKPNPFAQDESEDQFDKFKKRK